MPREKPSLWDVSTSQRKEETTTDDRKRKCGGVWCWCVLRGWCLQRGGEVFINFSLSPLWCLLSPLPISPSSFVCLLCLSHPLHPTVADISVSQVFCPLDSTGHIKNKTCPVDVFMDIGPKLMSGPADETDIQRKWRVPWIKCSFIRPSARCRHRRNLPSVFQPVEGGDGWWF